MEATTLNFISAFAASASCIAAIAALFISWRANSYQKNFEKNKIFLIKNQEVINSLQKIINTFAHIKATSDTVYSTERTMKLQALSDDLKYHSSVVASLNQVVGEKLRDWTSNKNENDESVSYVVFGCLSRGTKINGRYDNLFRSKSEELISIQDYLFNLMV